jgi:ELWxxDGT repeat protein
MQTASERKLWKTDGTAAGTVQIAVAEPFYILDNAVGMVNNKMIFYAHNTVDGYEPYVSDGTAAGTLMLSNINPAGNSWITQSQNAHLRFNSAYCFFVANNGTAKALWRTDGTPAGTIQLTTNAQAAASDVSGGSYTDVDETGLWMIQYDGMGSGANNKLYRSDGTVAGTYLVATGLSYGQYLKIYQSGLWMQSRNTGIACQCRALA